MRAVQAIHANATRQARLVDDLLDSGRILSGKLQLQPTHIPLEEPLRASIEIVQPAAVAKEIELTLEVESPRPHVQADSMRLQLPTRAYSGLGLGLAIVKYVVEAHGGSACYR